MTDKIHIKDLLLQTIIGVNDDERTNKQDILINIDLDVDTRTAGKSDQIEDSVSYRTVAKKVIALVETSEFFLVEKMADEIAAICLEDSKVESAQVTVEKPGAVRYARSVGVTIVRNRENA